VLKEPKKPKVEPSAELPTVVGVENNFASIRRQFQPFAALSSSSPIFSPRTFPNRFVEEEEEPRDSSPFPDCAFKIPPHHIGSPFPALGSRLFTPVSMEYSVYQKCSAA